jgi:anti-sigma regulatory factor (Ser/Thr protein kinase)
MLPMAIRLDYHPRRLSKHKDARENTMALRPKSIEIRQFIIDELVRNSAEIARLTAERFGITRQAVGRHLTALVSDGILRAEGEARDRRYVLVDTKKVWDLSVEENPEGDVVWRELVRPELVSVTENVAELCRRGFVEVYDNAIEHAGGTGVLVEIGESAGRVTLSITDNGVGLFEKLRLAFGLEDHLHALIELSKGRLTTDPDHHVGQGIFLAWRAFDQFWIGSGDVMLMHRDEMNYPINLKGLMKFGTRLSMSVRKNSDVEWRAIVERYTGAGRCDPLFSSTHVPLSLAKSGTDPLETRSQARRILARLESFDEVMLDFEGIKEIGQAFADEIFRVFRSANPQVTLVPVNASEGVRQMISRSEKGEG